MPALQTPPRAGATLTATGAQFCVWAPAAKNVEVLIEDIATALTARSDGYFVGEISGARAGTLYRYRVDGKGPYPDPCSWFQPQGPHGPSMLVDSSYAWRDAGWPGVQMHGQVIYELHIGTFTPQGTFDAAIEELDELKALGITTIEVMPIAEFPGRWNWGYDGVQLFAPFHGYGDYDAFKRFVDAAHQRGIGVILDVVYNHLGPDGNYLACFSADYFTDRYKNDWGQAINFDGENSRPVRDFFIDNARYWIAEFHLDGLRLDATQSILDKSRPHILVEIVRAARAAAGERQIIVVAENEPQKAETLLPVEEDGCGLDGMWNDDFHHSARVALTGRHEGYLTDYRGKAQEFVSAAKYGFLYQGQYYHWQKQGRGSPVTSQRACSFITFTQNHDQVANTFYGQRCVELSSSGRLRAITALLLLAPQTPMLFMGQEYGATTPFMFFTDHNAELRPLIHQGRREFVAQFPSWATPEAQQRIPDPGDEQTFFRSKLDFAERKRNASTYELHKDLLRLRRNDAVLSAQDWTVLDGAVLSDKAFLLRWFDAEQGDRLLLVNLGDELEIRPAPEPLLAPPRHKDWQLVWHSDSPSYGGPGIGPSYTDHGWQLGGECAAFFIAQSRPTS